MELKQLLEKVWTTTDLEEPYILTPDEECMVVTNATDSAKKHLTWKLSSVGYSEGETLLKISQTDWNKEIDRERILKDANSKKHYDIWQKEQRKKEREEAIVKLEQLKSDWTYKRVYGLMAYTSLEEYGKKLICNDANKKFIQALCYFFSDDIRFETELGFSFNKGLMLRGNAGLGKTFLLKCIQKNGLHPFKITSMLDISEAIRSEGGYTMPSGPIYIDDVGTEEPEILHYGTRINFFKNYIETIYLKNNTFRNLIISTNNSFQEIENKYGFRVRSRMKDMFNIIDVMGTDMRGLNSNQ